MVLYFVSLSNPVGYFPFNFLLFKISKKGFPLFFIGFVGFAGIFYVY